MLLKQATVHHVALLAISCTRSVEHLSVLECPLQIAVAQYRAGDDVYKDLLCMLLSLWELL